MTKVRQAKTNPGRTFGNRMQKPTARKSLPKILTIEERNWLTTLCFYGEPRAAKLVLKKDIWQMKSKDIMPILERLNKYLRNRLLEPEKRTRTERIRNKFQQMLEIRKQGR